MTDEKINQFPTHTPSIPAVTAGPKDTRAIVAKLLAAATLKQAKGRAATNGKRKNPGRAQTRGWPPERTCPRLQPKARL